MPSAQTEEDWKPTPPDRLIIAMKRDGTRCEYKDLQVGDIFQALFVEVGMIVDPLSTGPDLPTEASELWAICLEPPIKGYNRPEGFAVCIETGTLDQMIEKAKTFKH